MSKVSILDDKGDAVDNTHIRALGLEGCKDAGDVVVAAPKTLGGFRVLQCPASVVSVYPRGRTNHAILAITYIWAVLSQRSQDLPNALILTLVFRDHLDRIGVIWADILESSESLVTLLNLWVQGTGDSKSSESDDGERMHIDELFYVQSKLKKDLQEKWPTHHRQEEVGEHGGGQRGFLKRTRPIVPPTVPHAHARGCSRLSDRDTHDSASDT